MKGSFPKYSRSTIEEKYGINAVSRVVNDHFRWLFRQNHNEDDFGIDGYIDKITDEYEVTGQGFAVQIKSGKSYFKTKSSNGFIFYGENKHLNYYLNLSTPVLIIIHNEKRSKAYWELFDIEKIIKTEKGWKINIPKYQVFDLTAKDALNKILGPTLKYEDDKENFSETLNSLDDKSKVVYVVDKIEIQTKNLEPIINFFNRLESNFFICKNTQNKINILISGYDNDTRELWEIDEVISWLKLVDPYINWFYFCDLEDKLGILPAYALSICSKEHKTINKINSKCPPNSVDPDVLFDLVMKPNFIKLNDLTDKLGLPEEDNERISKKAVSFFYK